MCFLASQVFKTICIGAKYVKYAIGLNILSLVRAGEPEEHAVGALDGALAALRIGAFVDISANDIALRQLVVGLQKAPRAPAFLDGYFLVAPPACNEIACIV
jgi:hypothetical protein